MKGEDAFSVLAALVIGALIGAWATSEEKQKTPAPLHMITSATNDMSCVLTWDGGAYELSVHEDKPRTSL